MDSLFPDAEWSGTRVMRRWSVSLKAPAPIEADLPGLGAAIVVMLQALRRSAFRETGKDIERLAPSVLLERVNGRELTVRIEYDPTGFIGDCELMCLRVPIKVLDALWLVDALQGRSRDMWRWVLL